MKVIVSLIQALEGRHGQVDFWVRGQFGLQRVWGYSGIHTKKSCLRKKYKQNEV